MNFDIPTTPEAKDNPNKRLEDIFARLDKVNDPRKIIFLAKILGIRTFLQRTPIMELVKSSLRSMDENQLKEFEGAHSELLAIEDEDEKGGE